MTDTATLIRQYMTLCEAQAAENVYAHVSPANNLAAILQQGLVPNVAGGNYSGYWESLPGVYVTHSPRLLRHHLMARDMQGHYLIVLVQLGGKSFIDEDKIDDLLGDTANAVLKKHGLSRDDVENIEIDNELGHDLVASFRTALGPPNRTLAKDPTIIEEFIEAWLSERIYGGEGPGGDWWTYAKEFILGAFPTLSNEAESLRIPRQVGYSGKTRIVAVIEVTDGQPRVVKGTVPASAGDLIHL